MARSKAVVAVALVVVEVATAVVVNLAIEGAWWLWPALVALVAVTCALVWRQHRRGAASIPSTSVRTTATARGIVEDSPTDVPYRGGDVDVVTKASWWGVVRRSGTNVRR